MRKIWKRLCVNETKNEKLKLLAFLEDIDAADKVHYNTSGITILLAMSL
jgi:hypothetical protein